MHADTATRQHWMSVLAHSQPAELAARLNALNITADYEVIRAAETGLVQIQARMGGTGERFFAGDATLTRAAVRLTDGTLGYSWVQGRDKHFKTYQKPLLPRWTLTVWHALPHARPK